MPKKNLQNASEDEKNIMILEQAIKRNKKEQSAILKTMDMQGPAREKLWVYLLLMTKRAYENYSLDLSDEDKYDLGIDSGDVDKDLASEMWENAGVQQQIDFDREMDLKTGKAIFDPKDLNTFKNYFVTMGMFEAKAYQDLAKDRRAIREGLPDNYTDEQKDIMADYMVTMTNNRNAEIINCAGGNDMLIIETPKTEDGQSYEDCMKMLVRKDLEERFNANPNMTVQEYMNLIQADNKETERFLRKNKCTLDDRVYDVNRKKIEKDVTYKKGASAEEKERVLHDRIIGDMAFSYLPAMREAWRRQGREMYRNGLQKSEKAEYDEGVRISSSRAKYLDDDKKIIEAIPNLQEMMNAKTRENILANTKSLNEELLSKKPLDVRSRPGISEALYNPDTMPERVRGTRGAIAALEATGTKWKYHSSDSATYTKMMKSVRDYKDALAAHEGGKAMVCRREMFNRCMKYIKDKYSLRDSPNGQERFDSVMSLLYQEMKPEEFRKLVDQVNLKRDPEHQISVEKYQKKLNGFMQTADRLDLAAQKQSENDATMLSETARAELGSMTVNYGYDVNKEYPAIGTFGKAEGHSLSANDYNALVYAGAVNSKNAGRDRLYPEQDGVEDGKKTALNALNSYAAGDPEYLASILSLGIQKIQKETDKMPEGKEKQCMKEMEARMGNMLSRDPYLKKVAMSKGLTEKAYEKSIENKAPQQKREIQRTESLNEIVM